MNITLADIISERIRHLRDSRGITQAELARELRVTRASVNSWETGTSMPSLERLVMIASYFHVTTDYLLGLESKLQIDVSPLNFDEQELVNRMLHYMFLIHEKL